MSTPEIAFRMVRLLRNQFERFSQGKRYWADVQIPANSANSGLNVSNIDSDPYVASAERIMLGELTLFGSVSVKYGDDPPWNTDPISNRTAPLKFGKTLDYRDERLVGDIKYLWEPNRHYHLVSLAQAYALTSKVSYLTRIVKHIESWILRCPYGLGPNWCSSLELAIRLINWWLTYQLIGGLNSPAFDDVSGRNFRELWFRSIYQHVSFIQSFYSRYSSANNHLIGESAAVVIATSVWPYWDAFPDFGRDARNILIKECQEQNFEDGVNKEQAIWYQQFVLDFLLLAGTCTNDSPSRFPQSYWDRMEALLEFVAAMRDSHGNMPMFGDADDGVVCKLNPDPDHCPFTSVLQKGAYIFGRTDFLPSENIANSRDNDWLKAICGGFKPLHRPENEEFSIPSDFTQGGYYTLESDPTSKPDARMIVKAGPLGYGLIAAHGHADSLSIYLTIDGKEILIDPGTFAYHTEPTWRNYFRGTSAHNTVRVDDVNQSTIGGNFLWMDHANTNVESLTRGDEADEIIARHDGYARLKDPVHHRRTIRHLKPNRQFLIMDELIGSGVHKVEIFFHFSENCQVSKHEETWKVEVDHVVTTFEFSDEHDQEILYKGNTKLPMGWISRSFGDKTASPTLVCRKLAILPKTFVTKIEY